MTTGKVPARFELLEELFRTVAPGKVPATIEAWVKCGVRVAGSGPCADDCREPIRAAYLAAAGLARDLARLRATGIERQPRGLSAAKLRVTAAGA